MNRLRRSAHHIVDQIVKSNGYARLRHGSNGNADSAGLFVPAQTSEHWQKRGFVPLPGHDG